MKTAYIIVVGILDIVLLAVILVSASKQSKLPVNDGSTGSASQTSVTSVETVNSPVVSTDKPAELLPPATSPAETYASETPAVTTETELLTQTTTAATAPESTAAQTSPSAQNYSTDAYGEYADFGDTFLNGADGFIWNEIPNSAEQLTDFSQVTGGWKAYIVTSPDDHDYSVIYLLNIHISGTEKEALASFDWNYYLTPTGEEGIDPEPDSVFSGIWTKGMLVADGGGTVLLEQFYREGGRETALGKINFPDGTKGAIALVRP